MVLSTETVFPSLSYSVRSAVERISESLLLSEESELPEPELPPVVSVEEELPSVFLSEDVELLSFDDPLSEDPPLPSFPVNVGFPG